jgi:hypothetical protein
MRGVLALFVLGFCILFKTNAQKVQYSTPIKVSDKTLYSKVLGANSEVVFSAKLPYGVAGYNAILEVYSKELKIIKSIDLFNNRDESYLISSITPQGILVFYSVFYKDKNNYEIKVKSLNNNLVSERKDTTLFVLDKNLLDYSLIDISSDKKTNSIQIVFPSSKSTNSYDFKSLILNNQLSTISSSLFKINFDGKLTLHSISNMSSSFIAVFKDEVRQKQRTSEDIWSVVYSGKNENLFINKFQSDSLDFSNVKLVKNQSISKFYVGGLYNFKKSESFAGYFLWSLDTFKTPNLIFHEFTYDLIDELAGKNIDAKGIYNLKLNDLVTTFKDEVYFVCQEYLVTREVFSDYAFSTFQSSNVRNFFYYNNIIVVKMKDKKQEWHKILRKDQISVNDNGLYSSYKLGVFLDKLILVYNNLSKNDWTFSYFIIDSKGQAENKIILTSNEYISRNITIDGAQTGLNEMIFPTYLRNKSQSLFKVTF